MDYAALIRASLGNPTNEQLREGTKAAFTMLKNQFGAAAVQSLLRDLAGEDVVPQPAAPVAPAPKVDLSDAVAALRNAAAALENAAR